MKNEELIKVCKSSISGSGSRNLLKDTSTSRDGTFLHIVTSTKTDLRENVIVAVSLYSRCAGELWKSSDYGVRNPYPGPGPDRIQLGGDLHSPDAPVVYRVN